MENVLPCSVMISCIFSIDNLLVRIGWFINAKQYSVVHDVFTLN